AWVGFALITGTYADNVRYMSSLPSFLGYALLIAVGNIACLVCLCLAIRGWWRVLAAPIWFLCLVELLIIVFYFAAAAGLIHPKPWSERSRVELLLQRENSDSVSPLRGFHFFSVTDSVG